jgi:hypothetical protein
MMPALRAAVLVALILSPCGTFSMSAIGSAPGTQPGVCRCIRSMGHAGSQMETMRDIAPLEFE